MFNHARTLLVNLAGSTGYFSDYPGEELIPAGYQQLELPTYLDVIRMRIFGANPDRVMLNYRSAQLLQLISTTELQQHVLALDSRLTYGTPQFLFDVSKFSPQVNRNYGSSQLTVLGESMAPDSSGQCSYNYRITVSAGNVTIQRLVFPASLSTEPITLTNGLSQTFDLPFSGYSFRLDSDDPASWSIRGFLRPKLALSEIEQSLRSVGEPYLLQLFGVTNDEPYLTFRNCWNRHPEFAYRFGGLVLALIYRTEEIRNG